MILSVVFIAIFGKSYIIYFSVPAIPTHCRRQVDTLLLPGNHAENIITMGVHGTTVVMLIANTVYRNMLNTSMNSNVARFRHTQKHKDVLCIK